jgi:hypothetical protein
MPVRLIAHFKFVRVNMPLAVPDAAHETLSTRWSLEVQVTVTINVGPSPPCLRLPAPSLAWPEGSCPGPLW